jgi:hypothetical protein
MNRHNRQKRPTGRYLRAKCGQNYNQVANGLIVWNQPSTSRRFIPGQPSAIHRHIQRDRRDTGVPGAGRGHYGSELRSHDLSSCRIRRIKAVELGGIRRPETGLEEVAPAKLHLVHLRSFTWHDVDSLLGTAGFEPATSTVTVNQKPVNIRN